jgi:hypothetical protein
VDHTRKYCSTDFVMASLATPRMRLDPKKPGSGHVLARAAAPALYRLTEGGIWEHGHLLSHRWHARSRWPPLLPPHQLA